MDKSTLITGITDINGKPLAIDIAALMLEEDPLYKINSMRDLLKNKNIRPGRYGLIEEAMILSGANVGKNEALYMVSVSPTIPGWCITPILWISLMGMYNLAGRALCHMDSPLTISNSGVHRSHDAMAFNQNSRKAIHIAAGYLHQIKLIYAMQLIGVGAVDQARAIHPMLRANVDAYRKRRNLPPLEEPSEGSLLR